MLEITQAEIVGRLRFDNPWWDEGAGAGKVQFEDKPRRNYFLSFFSAVQDKSIQRAVVLMGPRRVGKTVMVYHAINALIKEGISAKSILYLSLETPIYTGLSLERIINYFRELFQHKRDADLFVFFDEVQYLKDWEIHLKSLVDSYPNYKFVATGSAAAALRLKSNESGAGRFSDYILPPLTFAEYLRFIGREQELISVDDTLGSEVRTKYTTSNINQLNHEFIRYLNFGGYPEAVFSDTIRANPSQYIKSDIIDKVLLRDLPSLYGISDIQELNRLFTVLAYNTSNEVSLENLSKASGVAKNTIKRYLEYLEAAFLIRCVNRVDQNAERFKRAVSFKVYLTNPSMRAALFGEVNADSTAMGALAETAVFSQWAHLQGMQGGIYYARWKSGEVDMVYLDQRVLTPLWITEVKWSDRPFSWHQELDNCVEFAQKNPPLQPAILITSRTIQQQTLLYKDINFSFLPTSLYTYVVGKNLLHQV